MEEKVQRKQSSKFILSPVENQTEKNAMTTPKWNLLAFTWVFWIDLKFCFGDIDWIEANWNLIPSLTCKRHETLDLRSNRKISVYPILKIHVNGLSLNINVNELSYSNPDSKRILQNPEQNLEIEIPKRFMHFLEFYPYLLYRYR